MSRNGNGLGHRPEGGGEPVPLRPARRPTPRRTMTPEQTCLTCAVLIGVALVMAIVWGIIFWWAYWEGERPHVTPTPPRASGRR